MKDLYTFDASLEEAGKSYEQVQSAYSKILERILGSEKGAWKVVSLLPPQQLTFVFVPSCLTLWYVFSLSSNIEKLNEPKLIYRLKQIPAQLEDIDLTNIISKIQLEKIQSSHVLHVPILLILKERFLYLTGIQSIQTWLNLQTGKI